MPRHQATPIRRAPGCLWAKPGVIYLAGKQATPYFETSSEKYSWMNRICSIATGSRKAGGRTFEVFQVL
jgi:hypothetical protein